MNELERKLYILIKELYEDIVSMTPIGGFSSPRDLQLVKEANKKAAILDSLQEAMRIINPGFDIRV